MPREHTNCSKDLVRIQFISKNLNTRNVLNFTSRLQVQHKTH